MKGESIGRELERGGDAPGRHPVRARFHKQTKHVEPVFLRQRCKRCEGIRLFHISICIEIFGKTQAVFQ